MPSGFVTPAAGGGSQPITRQTLFGNPVTIANNASADLTWDDGTSGPNQLLNLAVLAAPTVLVAGVYAVSVTIQPSVALTANGVFFATLFIDPDNADAEVSAAGIANAAGGQGSTPIIAVTSTFYAPAGSPIKVNVSNFDGAATRAFVLAQANVQRLS